MKRSEKNHKDSSTGGCGGHQREREEGFQECQEGEGGYKGERKQRDKLSSYNLRLNVSCTTFKVAPLMFVKMSLPLSFSPVAISMR